MAFRFKLEHEDGTSADPPTLHTAVPNWAPGDSILKGSAKRDLVVVEIRADADGELLASS